MLYEVITGRLSTQRHDRVHRVESKNKWLFASLFGILAEVLQMVIILLTAKPLYQALELVNIIGLPMIFGNGVAIGMFIAIADSFFREREKIAAINSQKVLTIAQESLPFLTLGLNSETAEKTAKIIYKQLNLAAVSFTTTDKCLAHVRITSYNVCYTKLLRLSGKRIHAQLF